MVAGDDDDKLSANSLYFISFSLSFSSVLPSLFCLTSYPALIPELG
jgi:hypothetical protein